ncbi:MAG: hypothetical protein Q8Q09_05125 [Deltaproteobacteria bacterium]|nr:hypothetical protein [Deltaproteobacteria bacterium]
MSLQCATVALASVASSGCLLDRRIAGEGEYLTPLSPPVIVQERVIGASAGTDPLPGDIIVTPTPTGGSRFDITFGVTVRFDTQATLLARLWLDRDRNCSPESTPNPDGTVRPPTCGFPQRLPNEGRLTAPEAGIERKLSFTLSFATPNKCTRVDLYLAPSFRAGDPAREHDPRRPSEVAHARWFVVVPSTSGEEPRPRECNDLNASR